MKFSRWLLNIDKSSLKTFLLILLATEDMAITNKINLRIDYMYSRFTQPMMYHEIGKRPNLYKLYTDKLIHDGAFEEKQIKSLWEKQWASMNEAYAESRGESFNIKKWRVPTYHRVVDFSDLGELKVTGLDS